MLLFYASYIFLFSGVQIKFNDVCLYIAVVSDLICLISEVENRNSEITGRVYYL
jgi:hypothetical protein